jgi:hypothetical protein
MSDPSKPAKAARVMPKGGRKGGAVFPRMDLEAAVGYAKRLVSKTHTGPQAKDIVYSGVLDAKGSGGDVKISALKQYGFTTGDSAKGFSASEHAKQLVAAPPEEIRPHYKAAVLRPKIFKALFDTYHGDAVTTGKLKQRAAGLNVHPEEAETCIEIYLKSAQLAGLVTAEGDSYRHIADSQVLGTADDVADNQNEGDKGEPDSSGTEIKDPTPPPVNRNKDSDPAASNANSGDLTRPRAIFNVNVNLDSSLDTDKLLKQLELLKKFGAI